MAERYVIGQKVSEKLTEIIINEYDDAIYIDVNDTSFMNKVIDLFQWFDLIQVKINRLQTEYEKEVKNINMPDEVEELMAKPEILNIHKKYNSEIISLHKEICGKFDEVFGKGTIRKYFRKLYEAFGNEWVPDTECIEDFITEIIPVIEKLFENRKASIRRRYTKKKK